MQMHQKTFEEGYIEGWHSVRPGSNPDIPAYAVPAGKTPYEYGFELGRRRAQSFSV